MQLRPHAVLFDLDGTLLNSERIRDLLRDMICGIMGLASEKFHSGGKTLDEYLATTGLAPKEVALYRRLWRLGEEAAPPRAFRDANVVLEMLAARGVEIGIITNRKADAHLINVMRASGLKCHRSSFVVAHHKNPFWARTRIFLAQGVMLPCPVLPSPYGKPDARMIGAAAWRLGNALRERERIWYVGDTLVDLGFAKANGFKFAGTLRGETRDRSVWEAHGADLILKNLRDLLHILK